MWTGSRLNLPSIMWRSYRNVLLKHNKLSACEAGTNAKNIVGGQTDAETFDHFTYRFPNSVSRLCYLCLNPKGETSQVSSDLQTSFAVEEVHLLDLAAGTGAAAVGILATLSELRRQKKLPTLPLTVKIFAADISPKALEIYAEIINDLKPELNSQAIKVEVKMTLWDASDASQIASICDEWLAAAFEKELFVIVSNLSGVGNETLEKFKRSFQHVTERLATKPSTFLWIEHHGTSAVGFLKKVHELIFAVAPWLTGGPGNKQEGAKYKWLHELQNENKILPGGLLVAGYSRYTGA